MAKVYIVKEQRHAVKAQPNQQFYAVMMEVSDEVAEGIYDIQNKATALNQALEAASGYMQTRQEDEAHKLLAEFATPAEKPRAARQSKKAASSK